MRSRDLNQRGSISIAAVFGAAVLAAAVLLVLNSGARSSGKIKLQNAADAAALSAATWMGRALNVISMNNVTQSQLLALAILIPSLYGGIQDALKVIQVEMAACSGTGPAVAACEAYLGLEEAALAKIELLLTPVISAAEPPAGALWVVMRALQAESTATARAFPAIAMIEAVRIARENGADSALMLSRTNVGTLTLALQLPVHVGSFGDLCDATRRGSPREHSRGYHGLYDYPLGVGPLGYYSRALLDNLVASWVSLNTGLSYFVRRRVESNYAELCDDPEGDGKPRPVLLEEDQDGGLDATRKLLDFIGVAKDTVTPPLGGRAWTGPLGSTRIAYSQVRVYNATAFDLFAQNWRVKLVPALAVEDGTMGLPKSAEASGALDDLSLWNTLGRLNRTAGVLNNH